MKTGRIILHVLNGINVLILVLLVLKTIYFILPIFNLSFFQVFLVLAFFYMTKILAQARFKIEDPMRANRTTNFLYHAGMGCIMLAILAIVMHWPYSFYPLVLGTGGVLVAFVLSLVVQPTVVDEQNPDILDDIL